MSVLPSRNDVPANFCTYYKFAIFLPRIEIFFSSRNKKKKSKAQRHKSAAGNKVMHFTAYDPNTRGAKLAFSRSN